MSYLSGIAGQTGLDVGAMDVEVAKVSFERDEARATIAIRPKNVRAPVRWRSRTYWIAKAING